MNRKLYKSRKNKVIGGVCGGLAEYMNADPTIIRLAWVLLAVITSQAGGIFVILYIAAMIIIPYKSEEASPETSPETVVDTPPSDRNRTLAIVIGAGFIVYGLVRLAERVFGNINFRIFPLNWIPTSALLPVLLVIAGLAVIFLPGRKIK